MSASTDEYLSEICDKQERIIKRLEYICVLLAIVALTLAGARFGWWHLS